MHRSGRCDGCEGGRTGIPPAGAHPAGDARPVTGARPPEGSYAPGTEGTYAPDTEGSYGQGPGSPGPAPASSQGPAPAHPQTPVYAPAPVARLASPVGLAHATVALLVVCAVVDAVALWSDFTMYGLMDKVLADGVDSVAVGDLDRADNLQAATGLAQVVSYLATAVLFVLWFRRVRVNAEVFAPDGHRMSRGWSVGGWLVPVVNFWFPKKIANDTWNASLPYGPDGSVRAVPRTGMNAWWAMWLVTSVLGWLGGRMYDKAEAFESIRAASGVLIVADAADIAAAVLAVLFVRRLTAMQGEKAAQGPVPPVAYAGV
ncbi:DUF4328 domain-containing protein [Streptomyces albireticuli]|uniref:DUF4328 domain-containing protein n=1 Tax=Streptomyces albireticuli TaxID=1940 RepID=UPI0036C56E66